MDRHPDAPEHNPKLDPHPGSNTEKDPADWVTGDEPMTGAQASSLKTLSEDLGWRPYPNKHYESVFTRFYQGGILPRKFGFDKRRAHFSSLVLTGQMTRDEALARIAQPACDAETMKQDFEYVATKLGLSIDELRALAARLEV